MGRVPHVSLLRCGALRRTIPPRSRPHRFDIPSKVALLLDAGDVADGAAGGAGGEGGVGLEGLRDFAGAGGGLPCGGALRLLCYTL
jgi:hypothetical protein